MSFKINSLYLSDGYKVGHKAMLAPGTTTLEEVRNKLNKI